MLVIKQVLFCLMATFVATIPIMGVTRGDAQAGLSVVDVLVNTLGVPCDNRATIANNGSPVSSASVLPSDPVPGLVVIAPLLATNPPVVSNAIATTSTTTNNNHPLHECRKIHINRRDTYREEDELPEAHFNSSSNLQLANYTVAIAIVLEVVAGTLFVLIVWFFFRKLKQRYARHQRRQNAEQQRAAAVLNSHPAPADIELQDLDHSNPEAPAPTSAPATADDEAAPTSPTRPERSQLARCAMRGSGGLGPIFERAEQVDNDDDDNDNPVEPWSPLPASPVTPSPEQLSRYKSHHDTTTLEEGTMVADNSSGTSSNKLGYERDHDPSERYHSFATLT